MFFPEVATNGSTEVERSLLAVVEAGILDMGTDDRAHTRGKVFLDFTKGTTGLGVKVSVSHQERGHESYGKLPQPATLPPTRYPEVGPRETKRFMRASSVGSEA